MPKISILTAFLALLVLSSSAFAYDLVGPLRPIDLVWYMVAFCAAVILFILHHMMIQQKKRR
ncbi:MAG TPA: hypothetical protein VJI12_01515 [archaeon]|nr:hypothetical protein [archaeon]